MIAFAISLTEYQEALSERQFGKQTHDTYFLWSWSSRTKRWNWFSKHLGYVIDFFQDISFENDI